MPDHSFCAGRGAGTLLPRAVARAIWWSCSSIKISRICSPKGASGAAEFHHRALSEPDVNLSAHPAPSIRLLAQLSNSFALVMELLPSPVGHLSLAGYRSPFGPAPLQSLHPYYGLLRPCAPHRYSCPRGDLPLELLP